MKPGVSYARQAMVVARPKRLSFLKTVLCSLEEQDLQHYLAAFNSNI
jgi:hypothetical protein